MEKNFVEFWKKWKYIKKIYEIQKYTEKLEKIKIKEGFYRNMANKLVVQLLLSSGDKRT